MPKVMGGAILHRERHLWNGNRLLGRDAGGQADHQADKEDVANQILRPAKGK